MVITVFVYFFEHFLILILIENYFTKLNVISMYCSRACFTSNSFEMFTNECFLTCLLIVKGDRQYKFFVISYFLWETQFWKNLKSFVSRYTLGANMWNFIDKIEVILEKIFVYFSVSNSKIYFWNYSWI